MDFCKSFNDKTKNFKESTPIPVVITAFSGAQPIGPCLSPSSLRPAQSSCSCGLKPTVCAADRTFTYEMKTPQTTYFIKQAIGLKSGAGKPGDEVAAEISIKKVYEIAKIKQQVQRVFVLRRVRASAPVMRGVSS